MIYTHNSDEDYVDYPECYGCTESLKSMDKASYWLEAVLEDLSSLKPIEDEKFNDHLEELCHVLNVKFPKNMIRHANP
jgi:hypothetical protein